jgi:hypothetical protein
LAPPPQPGAADQARDRLTFLLETLDNARDHIVLPTPVLTELLVSARSNAGAKRPSSIRTITMSKRFPHARGFCLRACGTCHHVQSIPRPLYHGEHKALPALSTPISLPNCSRRVSHWPRRRDVHPRQTAGLRQLRMEVRE